MPWYKDQSGKPVWVDDAPQPVIAAKPDPTMPYQAGQAAADLTGKTTSNAGQQLDNQYDAATMPARIRKANAEADAAEAAAAKARAERNNSNPLNAQRLSAAEADAMSKLRTIDRIRQTHNNSWLPTIGFGAETMAGIGGTGAADVAADVESLKAGGALAEVLKMSQETGKNPFTPMSNSDVDLISKNIGNLNQRQSYDNFNRNLQNYQDAYTRAYAGAHGQRTLDAEIERHLPNIAPEKRDAYRLDAIRRYNERMARDGGRGLTQPRSRLPKRPASSGGWGKVEVSD